MKFKYQRKGRITQGFGRNHNPAYQSQGLKGHTGVDWVRGYGKPVQTDNKGLVYKVVKSEDSPSNWQAVYLLTKVTKDVYMETGYGHLSEVWVKPGERIPEDAFVGAEGNRGLVYSGGVRITPEMQKKGDRRGSHVHEWYRPVMRVKTPQNGSHWLRKANGTKYRDKEGYYYEILYPENGFNGCVDPREWDYQQTLKERLSKLVVVLKYLRDRISKPTGSMFNYVSKGGVGAAGTILSLALKWLGIDIDEGTATEAVINLLGSISFLLWLYGQLDRKDLVWGFWRK